MKSSPSDHSPEDGSSTTSHSSLRTPHSTLRISDESPGVPGFKTWRGVYLFVFAFFVGCVVLLALFSRYFA